MHILIGQMLCNALEYKLGYSHLVKEENKFFTLTNIYPDEVLLLFTFICFLIIFM